MNDSISRREPTLPEGGVRPSDLSRHSTSTPSGFRNLRVLVPENLHWHLRELANQSRMTFQHFIVSWLATAGPLGGDSMSPEPPHNDRPAPRPEPRESCPEGPSPGNRPSEAQTQVARLGSCPDHSGNPARVGPIFGGPTDSSRNEPDLNQT